MSRRWIFLRGLVRQQRHWEQFPQIFKDAFSEDEVVLIDLPGNGVLCDRPSPVSIREMVEAARKQIQLKRVQSPYYLLSISMGGMVAIEWMYRYRNEVEGAVIINTSLRNMGSFRDRLQPKNYPAIFKSLLLDKRVLAREKLILDISSNLYPHKAALARKWAGYGETHPTSKKNAVRQLLASALYRAPQKTPHENVLLLNSARDRLVKSTCSDVLAQTWGWPLRTHPTAGHDLPLDDGGWIVDQVQKWLS